MNAELLRDLYLSALRRARERQSRILMRIFLLRAGKSQKEICELLNLHKSTVSLLLAGKIKIDSRLDQIARYLNISRKKLDSLIRARKQRSIISHQRRWQIRKTSEDRCQICGEETNLYKLVCDRHSEANRRRTRARLGYNEWKPGSRGRPPLDAETP